MNTSAPVKGSVVVVTYKRSDYLRTCLEHLARQTVAPVETIVVDSSPDTLTENLVSEYAHVIYLRNERGAGYMATSRAIGMAYVTADVVAYIDDDAFADPDWLEQLLKRYTDSGVGAVGGRARNGQPGEESAGIDRIGKLLPDGTLTGNFAADPGHDVVVDHLIGCNMSMRRAAVQSLGGIQDHYPGTCLREDADTMLRLGGAGYRILFTPEAVVLHVGGTYAKGNRFDTRYKYYGARNHVVLLTNTLGFGDPHTRRYFGTVVKAVPREMVAGVSALVDPGRATAAAKARGIAGGFLRAGVLLAGTAVGTLAGARLAMEQRWLAGDHRGAPSDAT